MCALLKPIPYTSGDSLAPKTFLAWWGVYNSERSVRGLEHAGFDDANEHFYAGHTPDDAANRDECNALLGAE